MEDENREQVKKYRKSQIYVSWRLDTKAKGTRKVSYADSNVVLMHESIAGIPSGGQCGRVGQGEEGKGGGRLREGGVREGEGEVKGVRGQASMHNSIEVFDSY